MQRPDQRKAFSLLLTTAVPSMSLTLTLLFRSDVVCRERRAADEPDAVRCLGFSRVIIP